MREVRAKSPLCITSFASKLCTRAVMRFCGTKILAFCYDGGIL